MTQKEDSQLHKLIASVIKSKPSAKLSTIIRKKLLAEIQRGLTDIDHSRLYRDILQEMVSTQECAHFSTKELDHLAFGGSLSTLNDNDLIELSLSLLDLNYIYNSHQENTAFMRGAFRSLANVPSQRQ